MSLNFKQIEAFVAVADLGSFRRAAERLNTTQPNISSRIANLEARLGLSLMDRDAGSVRLTAKGRLLLVHARAVVAAAETFLTAAGDDALLRGRLRLGVTELVSHTWLRRFLVAMRARFPNVIVELTVDLSEGLSAALFARDLDLAFQNGPFDRPASGSVPLGHCAMVWVAAPGLAGSAGRLGAADLARLPILTHARGTQPWRQLTAHFAAAGVTARLVPSANVAACLQMTLDGLGVACLPQPMVAAPLAEGRLVTLDYPWRLEDLRFQARFDAATAPAYLKAAAELARSIAEAAEDKESLSSE